MKITPHEWNKYRKKALLRPLEPQTPPPVFGRFIVLPVMDELEELPGTLKSLTIALDRHNGPRTGVLLVINHSPDAPEPRRTANETLLRLLRTASPELLHGLVPGETLFWIDAASAGNELRHGVGEARRIGLDCALMLLAPEQRAEAFLCCLDADSPVAPDYLLGLEEWFRVNPEAGAVSIAVRHRPGRTAAEETAIRAYERYMADYVAHLKAAGSPYAFHTIGSAIAVRVPAYIAAGGMRVRRGAEDFYFLQAVRKVAPVGEYPTPLVFPAARPSDRVPFGTGPAVRSQLAGHPLPEYAAAQKSLADIKAKYDSETLHNEEEFRRMYLDFLQGQKDFPQTIMLKRQKELQNAMERGIKFRNEVSQMLDNAQKELEAPIIARLDSAIKLVATEKGYEFIMNTDAHAFPFINPTLGEDVTGAVMQKLQTIKEWIPNQNPQPAAQ